MIIINILFSVIFDMFDENKDGIISRAEMFQLLTQ
jgi:Ca2+-binding EF-hand superfamily protein